LRLIIARSESPVCHVARLERLLLLSIQRSRHGVEDGCIAISYSDLARHELVPCIAVGHRGIPGFIASSSSEERRNPAQARKRQARRHVIEGVDSIKKVAA